MGDEADAAAAERLSNETAWRKPRFPTRKRWAAQWDADEAAATTLFRDLDENNRRLVMRRWIGEAKRRDQEWRDQRFAHYCLRIPIIAGAATVPVLIGLNVPKWLTAVLGLMVAILTGLDSFFHLSVRWQLQRRAAIALNLEGWRYAELSGVYQQYGTHADALHPFLNQLEQLIQHFSISYLDVFEDEGRPQRATHK